MARSCARRAWMSSPDGAADSASRSPRRRPGRRGPGRRGPGRRGRAAPAPPRRGPEQAREVLRVALAELAERRERAGRIEGVRQVPEEVALVRREELHAALEVGGQVLAEPLVVEVQQPAEVAEREQVVPLARFLGDDLGEDPGGDVAFGLRFAHHEVLAAPDHLVQIGEGHELPARGVVEPPVRVLADDGRTRRGGTPGSRGASGEGRREVHARVVPDRAMQCKNSRRWPPGIGVRASTDSS